MKKLLLVILTIVLTASICMCGCSQGREDRDTLFQTSVIDALLAGVYDGETTYGELKEYGDFGIGTFHELDGEMIAFDNEFYQIKSDGKVYPVDDEMKTPFAAVTFFESDKTVAPETTMDYEELTQYLDNLIPTENIFYAIKIKGTFSYIKARSVSKQSKPYEKLVEVVADQPTFEFHDVTGTLAGFRCPEYVNGVNVPGYHLHFITEDRSAGGHVLALNTDNVEIEIDYTTEFALVLLDSNEFYDLDLTADNEGELEKVEN